MAGIKVRVYSTPFCPWCHKAKEFLKENNIEFEDIDVAKDPEAAKAMVEKTGQTGVPVIEIGNEFIVGFNKERISALLGIKG
jgi:glutaredoxin-like YruB-family protein